MNRFTREVLLEKLQFIIDHPTMVDANDLAFAMFTKRKLESGDSWAEKHEDLIVELSDELRVAIDNNDGDGK